MRSPFGFIEETINVPFAFRRKTMQSCKRQLFLEFDNARCERRVLRLQRSNTRHQLFNIRFAGSIHQILNRKHAAASTAEFESPQPAT